MHAAVAQQTHQVNGLAGLLGGIQGMDQGRFLEELAILNVLGDTGHLTTMAPAPIFRWPFAIAHLAVRQTHVHAACAQLGIGVLGLQRVQMRRALLIDRIALGAEVMPTSISRSAAVLSIKSFLSSRALPCTDLRAVSTVLSSRRSLLF